MELLGFRRSDGQVGTRNYVGVISTVVCANEVAEDIACQVLFFPFHSPPRRLVWN